MGRIHAGKRQRKHFTTARRWEEHGAEDGPAGGLARSNGERRGLHWGIWAALRAGSCPPHHFMPSGLIFQLSACLDFPCRQWSQEASLPARAHLLIPQLGKAAAETKPTETQARQLWPPCRGASLRCSPPANTTGATMPQSSCNSRHSPFPSRMLPGWRSSSEQAGNNINHARNKAAVVLWSLGELGGEFLF